MVVEGLLVNPGVQDQFMWIWECSALPKNVECFFLEIQVAEGQKHEETLGEIHTNNLRIMTSIRNWVDNHDLLKPLRLASNAMKLYMHAC